MQGGNFKTTFYRIILLVIYSVLFSLLPLGLYAWMQVSNELGRMLLAPFVVFLVPIYFFLGRLVLGRYSTLAVIFMAVVQALIMANHVDAYWLIGHILNIDDVTLSEMIHNLGLNFVVMGAAWHVCYVLGTAVLLVVRDIGVSARRNFTKPLTHDGGDEEPVLR